MPRPRLLVQLVICITLLVACTERTSTESTLTVTPGPTTSASSAAAALAIRLVQAGVCSYYYDAGQNERGSSVICAAARGTVFIDVFASTDDAEMAFRRDCGAPVNAHVVHSADWNIKGPPEVTGRVIALALGGDLDWSECGRHRGQAVG